MLKDPNLLCVSWEQTLGQWSPNAYETIIENAWQAAKGGRIHALSITDNPGGRPSLPAVPIIAELKKAGVELLVHLATRDRNRNEVESLLYGLRIAGISNLLILSGDYPADAGFRGKAKPVFDLDPVQVIDLVQGIDLCRATSVGDKCRENGAAFFTGAVMSPFKYLEAEAMGQYMKLEKKIRAGAQFIVLQVGYDIRKWHEALLWLKLKRYDVPVVASIYVLTYPVACAMNRNRIPGCVVNEKLMARVSRERDNPDNGREASLIRAAKMYAIAKGMGFSGVHIGGANLNSAMVEFVIQRGEELYSNWPVFVSEFVYSEDRSFYLFCKDPQTGLNNDTEAPRMKAGPASPSYWFARCAHRILFDHRSPLFKPLRALARWVDQTGWARNVFEWAEYVFKAAAFGCERCGDCALSDMAYLCPVANCPKNQRNGPCGGSQNGWCEVYPGEKRCVWVPVYERLKACGEESGWANYSLLPQRWSLYHTSSWINLYLGRDHHAGVRSNSESRT